VDEVSFFIFIMYNIGDLDVY